LVPSVSCVHPSLGWFDRNESQSTRIFKVATRHRRRGTFRARAEGGYVRPLQREKLSSTGSSRGIGREIGRNIVPAQDILESVATFDKLARDT
jgi:hypothetical protein